jgi:hypothetical protein
MLSCPLKPVVAEPPVESRGNKSLSSHVRDRGLSSLRELNQKREPRRLKGTGFSPYVNNPTWDGL